MITIDRVTITQIIGCLMQNPDLLSETDKYRLEMEDFRRLSDKYIFSAIYNLYINGAGNIHTVDIMNSLKDNSSAYDLIEKENGVAFLQDSESNANLANFNYYYNKLKKINLVIDLQKSGHDTSSIYCEDLLDKDRIKINDAFERMTTTDIINHFKKEITIYEEKYSSNSIVEESYACEGLEELLKELKESPEIGATLQGEIFNTVVRGGRKGKMYLRSAGTSVGKAIPDSTVIPTTQGWKKVEQIKIGDYLFDKDGRPTRVLGIYPQPYKKQIYKVYFKSGRTAECCDEHLWSCYSNKNDKYPNKLVTFTLKELLNNKKGLQDNKGNYRWSIPICKPIQYTKKEYSIDPYVLGLIIGDGSFRYTKEQKSFFFSSSDEELVKEIKERMNYSSYKKSSQKNYSWIFKADEHFNHKNVWVKDILKDYPDLWNKRSEDKFIPRDFLFGSVKQRFELLSGLLDTDGSVDSKGRVTFTTTSYQLKNNIIELCESLGLTCSCLVDKRIKKYSTGKCYRVNIKADFENKLRMFKLQRKIEIIKKYATNKKRKERRDRDSIIKIEKTKEYTDMTCFYVDNPEHLFLMNNCIVTHNTRNMVADAANIAYPIRYDTMEHRWIVTNPNPEKTLYIMTEQDTEEIKTMLLSFLTGISEEVFLYGSFTENEMPRIKTAIQIMETYKENMLFARIPDPCASIIKNLFRKYNLQYGVENFFYDYIFSSPAMLNEYRDLALREDERYVL